jgi:hypothetical protein
MTGSHEVRGSNPLRSTDSKQVRPDARSGLFHCGDFWGDRDQLTASEMSSVLCFAFISAFFVSL